MTVCATLLATVQGCNSLVDLGIQFPPAFCGNSLVVGSILSGLKNSATIQTFRLECLTGETSYRGGMDNVFLGALANNLPKKLRRLSLNGIYVSDAQVLTHFIFSKAVRARMELGKVDVADTREQETSYDSSLPRRGCRVEDPPDT